MILGYTEFITEGRNRKNGEPVSKHLLQKWIQSGYFNDFPLDAVKEIITWEHVFKSPISNSFYSKQKGWNITHDGTIRISDHWNFFARGTTHCKTVQEGFKDGWAKGIYNKALDKYDIVEFYDKPNNKEEFLAFRRQNFVDLKELFFKSGGQSKIDFGRQFVELIKSGSVIYKDSNIEAPLAKWKMNSLNPWLSVMMNGEKFKIEDPMEFTLTFNGKTYTRPEIFSELGIYRS